MQKAWEQYATGAYAKAEIGRLIAQRGVLTKNSLPLSDQSLTDLFKNPYYAGTIIDPWSGEEYQGRHLPMVSREVFARVQELVNNRKAAPRYRDREEFPSEVLLAAAVVNNT